jgi:lipoprotein NlpD
MDKKEKFKKFWQEMKLKYKLTFMNERTLEEVWSLRLSRLSVLITLAGTMILFLFLSSLLIINTPIRNYLPGYLPVEVREEIIQNSLRTDSIERIISIQALYLNNVSKILNGTMQIDSIHKIDSIARMEDQFDIPKSEKEENFLSHFEEEEKYNLSLLTPQQPLAEGVFFFKPVKGVISSAYDKTKKHYGIDLVAAKNEHILSTLDGTIIFTGDDPDYGRTIQIQHTNGFVSIYKHNDHLFKKVGDTVAAGEAIAIIGNTGKLSTGPHLHFELWYNGRPVNPTEYIAF